MSQASTTGGSSGITTMTGTSSFDSTPSPAGTIARTGQTGAASTGELSPSDFLPVGTREAVSGKYRPSLSYWADAWIRLKKNRQALASLIIVVFLVLFTLVGPFLWTVDPSEQVMSRISEGPSLSARSVLVQPTLDAWSTPVDGTLAEAPEKAADASALSAPTELTTLTAPTTVSVRLKWKPVAGATGYKVYRSDMEPMEGSLGLPIATVQGQNKAGYEDGYDLKTRSYFYAVVPIGAFSTESTKFASLEVNVQHAISLTEALQFDAAAQPGKSVLLPARPLGTDALGRDLLARLMAGARVSLFIGFVAPLFEVLLGIIVGGISGYFGGRVDAALMRFTDFMLALPFLLFMILFKIAFGAGPGENGIVPMLVALVVLSWTGPARLTRGQVLQLRESEFIQAAKLLGARPMTIILRHLLPNTLGVILVSLTFAIPSAIFTEAFLSFIGMGVVPPTPSWGSMCDDGIKTFLVHPHEFLFPALIISVTVLAFNLLGDGLRDALDPKMRSVS